MSVVLLVGCLGWCVVALLGWAAGGHAWWLDLPNHGPQYTMAVALAGIVLCFAARFYRVLSLFVVMGVVFGGRWGCAVGPSASGTSDGGVRVLLANVYSNNTDSEALTALIRDYDPDVIGLLEVNDRWLAELAPVREGWPEFREIARRDNFGIALYSRRPGSEVTDVSLGSGAAPSLAVDLPNGLRVILTHPVPPLGAQYSRARNEQLSDVGDALDSDSVVVMGDFNATPWSHHFPSSIARIAGGTWPSRLPAPMRIPIDHVLASPDVPIVRLSVGPDIGSDHRPVLAVVGADPASD